MDNPYSVDDILDELKKHREKEIAQNIPEIIDDKESTQSSMEQQDEDIIVPDQEESENNVFNIEPAIVSNTVDKDKDKTQEDTANDDLENIFAVFNDDRKISLAVDENILKGNDNVKTDRTSTNKNKKKWRQTKKGKICIAIIVVVLVLIFAFAGLSIAYVNGILDSLTDTEEEVESITPWTGMDELVEQFNTIYEQTDVYTYRDMVKQWYYTGIPCSSTHVINILIIGEDTRGSNITDDDTRADSAIIASLNQDTGEITLTSVLRDCYAYYEVTAGDESTGQFGKINGAMAYGGIDCYIRCVENMFKIDIDNYAITNFTSFEKIIDAMGGVTIEMTQAEINEINNHPSTYGNVTIDADAGEINLNGEQALAYCRIRHIDSDSVRADRQKTVLLEIFEKAKSETTLNIAKIVRTFLPYVKTGYSKSELISVATYGLSNNWLSFTTKTYTAPSNTTDENGNVITTCVGGTFFNTWCWKVDFPLLAQIVQTNIYGQTSIVLADNRPNFINLAD